MKNVVALTVLATSLLGCASHTTIDEKGRVVVHHFGYVQIVKPPIYPPDKKMNVTGVKLLGFSVGDGFTFGYKNNEYIEVPTDCRVLIVVNDSAQFEHLLNEISSIKEGDLCATISPK